MGMDFIALIRHPGCDEQLSQNLRTLEDTTPLAFQQVMGLWKEFGFFESDLAKPEWRDKRFSMELRLTEWPTLPNLDASYQLPEFFYLTVGKDTLQVYHLLRWQIFLTEPRWQKVMLDACSALCRLVQATDCVLTCDSSPLHGDL